MSTAVPGAPYLSPADEGRAAALVRIATFCLIGHAALSIFSAFAFATFLSGPPPAWLQTPENQRVLKIGWTFGPATTVVLGALAGLLHAMGKLGLRRALLIFVFGFTISLASELSGTGTGYPFGPYSYSGLLGWKIAGLVPFNIPTSWFFMLYASLAICGRVLTARDDQRGKWTWALVGGAVLTAWDVSMDPAMVKTAHWIWHLAPVEQQTTLQRLFVSDIFYGMPLSNWIGWYITGVVVSRVMLAFVPPTMWQRLVSPSTFPLVLYAVNGVLPIAICAKYGMWWAAGLGFLAMALPLGLALAKGAPAPEASPAPRTARPQPAFAGD
jgi:putative membrane protein